MLCTWPKVCSKTRAFLMKFILPKFKFYHTNCLVLCIYILSNLEQNLKQPVNWSVVYRSDWPIIGQMVCIICSFPSLCTSVIVGAIGAIAYIIIFLEKNRLNVILHTLLRRYNTSFSSQPNLIQTLCAKKQRSRERNFMMNCVGKLKMHKAF